MAGDFGEKLDKVCRLNSTLASLSKSQAVYFIISYLAENEINLKAGDFDEDSE